MPVDIKYRFEAEYVVASMAGDPTIDEFVAALQEIGGASVRWDQRCVIVDLTGVQRKYSFTEQLVIGQAAALNFGHLRKAAAVVPPERITRVGEKAAHHSGARQISVFASEQEAADWFRS